MSLRHYPVFNGAVMAQTGCAVIELRLKEKPMAFLLRHWIFLMAAQRRNFSSSRVPKKGTSVVKQKRWRRRTWPITPDLAHLAKGAVRRQ